MSWSDQARAGRPMLVDLTLSGWPKVVKLGLMIRTSQNRPLGPGYKLS